MKSPDPHRSLRQGRGFSLFEWSDHRRLCLVGCQVGDERLADQCALADMLAFGLRAYLLVHVGGQVRLVEHVSLGAGLLGEGAAGEDVVDVVHGDRPLRADGLANDVGRVLGVFVRELVPVGFVGHDVLLD